MDMDSNRILYEENINEKRSVASISKIMTALLAIESHKLDEVVIVGEEGEAMKIGIGIDTGGTCTDAVVYQFEKKEILAFGKTPTTKEDLSIGIGKAMDQLPPEYLPKWLKGTFQFVMPMLVFSYYPASVVCGWGEPVWSALPALPVGLIFLLLTLVVFRFGVRHYRSAGG